MTRREPRGRNFQENGKRDDSSIGTCAPPPSETKLIFAVNRSLPSVSASSVNLVRNISRPDACIHPQSGYREGMDEGKGETVQQGFDRGMRPAASGRGLGFRRTIRAGAGMGPLSGRSALELTAVSPMQAMRRGLQRV